MSDVALALVALERQQPRADRERDRRRATAASARRPAPAGRPAGTAAPCRGSTSSDRDLDHLLHRSPAAGCGLRRRSAPRRRWPRAGSPRNCVEHLEQLRARARCRARPAATSSFDTAPRSCSIRRSRSSGDSSALPTSAARDLRSCRSSSVRQSVVLPTPRSPMHEHQALAARDRRRQRVEHAAVRAAAEIELGIRRQAERPLREAKERRVVRGVHCTDPYRVPGFTVLQPVQICAVRSCLVPRCRESGGIYSAESAAE